MTKHSFRLPDIGEGIAEAEVVAWHVRVGDMVEEDQAIADMMTDKATVEMEAPVAGKVIALGGEVGDMLAIGSVLAVFETEDNEDEEDSPEECLIVEELPSAPLPPALKPVEAEAEAEAEVAVSGAARILASPAVRKRAHDLGIDLADVKLQGDRIRHSDLDTYLSYNSAKGYHAVPRAMKRADEQVRVIGMRRRIAENMAASKRHIPHFAYIEEFDVTAIEAIRADLNGARGERPKLTFLPFLIVAICRALPEFPMINAIYDEDAGIVTRHGAVHLGMATQTDAGLMVPVIRDAQDLNIWQLAREISRLAEIARVGKAKSEELSGGTLTITSLGPLGGIATTPVINRPQVAIIGPNKIVERPVIVNGEIEARKLMNLSISCDHRVIDGHDAASFVQAVKRLVETPVLMFAD